MLQLETSSKITDCIEKNFSLYKLHYRIVFACKDFTEVKFTETNRKSVPRKQSGCNRLGRSRSRYSDLGCIYWIDSITSLKLGLLTCRLQRTVFIQRAANSVQVPFIDYSRLLAKFLNTFHKHSATSESDRGVAKISEWEMARSNWIAIQLKQRSNWSEHFRVESFESHLRWEERGSVGAET